MSLTRLAVTLAVILLFSSSVLAEVPLEHFTRDAQYTEVKLSPGGDYLAAVAPREDRSVLVILDVESKEAVHAVQLGRNIHVSDVSWVGPERLIYSSIFRMGTLDERPRPTGDLFVMDADGSDARQLLGGEGGMKYPFQVLSTLPDDENRILVQVFRSQEGANAVHIDLRSGRTRELSRAPVRRGRYVASRSGALLVAQGNTEEGDIVIRYRPSESDPWRDLATFDPADGGFTVRAIDEQTGDLIVESNQNAETAGLVRLNPETGETSLLFRHSDVDPGFGALPGPSIEWDIERRRPIAVNAMPGRPERVILDNEDSKASLYRALANTFPGQWTMITSMTDDGSRGVVYVGSDVNPGDFYLLDTDPLKLTYLMSVRPWIETDKMRPMEPVVVEARDGTPLHGYLTLPDGEKPDQGWPLVVHPHGGPHGPRDEWGFNPDVQMLASRGYAVLQLNYRGSGGYGREFMYGGYREWGTSMQDDLTDATRWAIDKGHADRQRVCMYGASYGGYASLMGAVREPELYQCVIGYVGVYDLELMHQVGDIPEQPEGVAYLERAVGTDEEDMANRSPARRADEIEAAVFLVHGKEDIRAHYRHFEVMAEALDDAGKPYRSMVKDFEGHGFSSPDNRLELAKAMLDFLNAHTAVESD